MYQQSFSYLRPAPPPPPPSASSSSHYNQSTHSSSIFSNSSTYHSTHYQTPSERVSFLSNNNNEPRPIKPELKTRIELRILPVAVILIILLVIGIIVYQVLLSHEEKSRAKADPLMEQRRQFVRQMAKESWDSYVKYAWGQDGLRPMSQTGYEDLFGKNSGFGIVSALSTLWIMGFKEEFARGRDWIEENLRFGSIKKEIDVQQTVNYYLGGLMSCYALTGDELFVNKSVEIADVLDPVYRSKTGLPYWKLKPKSGEATLKTPFLASVGGQHLEYAYLSAVTGNRTYQERVDKIRSQLSSIYKQQGLYVSQLHIDSGTWVAQTSTLFSAGRAFYDYLIKSYVQSNHKDAQGAVMFAEAMAAVDRAELIKNSSTPEPGFLYARQYHQNVKYHKYDKYMNYDGCGLGAMFALGAVELPEAKYREDKERLWVWARELVETCVCGANRTETKLPPFRFYFDYKEEDEVNWLDSGRNVLSPDLAESFFILYRLTKDPKYREYAWQLAQAIHTHCRVPDAGYSRIKDVNQLPTESANLQDPDFLGSTLKYLYLLFADDSLMDLDQWVFNARGQPLPICGHNAAFQGDSCS